MEDLDSVRTLVLEELSKQELILEFEKRYRRKINKLKRIYREKFNKLVNDFDHQSIDNRGFIISDLKKRKNKLYQEFGKYRSQVIIRISYIQLFIIMTLLTLVSYPFVFMALIFVIFKKRFIIHIIAILISNNFTISLLSCAFILTYSQIV